MTHNRDYLEGLVNAAINEMRAKGIADSDLATLHRLKRALDEVFPPDPQHLKKDERQGHPASDEIMARASALIDLLIRGGETSANAAQSVARQLIASGVALPEVGGDVRGWKRLLDWREHLLYGSRYNHVKSEYQRFKEELETIPTDQRLRRAVGERLWDRRRENREAKHSA